MTLVLSSCIKNLFYIYSLPNIIWYMYLIWQKGTCANRNLVYKFFPPLQCTRTSKSLLYVLRFRFSIYPMEIIPFKSSYCHSLCQGIHQLTFNKSNSLHKRCHFVMHHVINEVMLDVCDFFLLSAKIYKALFRS